MVLPRMNSRPHSPLFCKLALAEGDFGFRLSPFNLSNLVRQRRQFRVFFNQLPDVRIARECPCRWSSAGETNGAQNERTPFRISAPSISWFGSRRPSRGILLAL